MIKFASAVCFAGGLSLLIVLSGLAPASAHPASAHPASAHASAARFFRYQAPAAWGLLASPPAEQLSGVHTITLESQSGAEVPARMAMAFYTASNPQYKSAEHYLRALSLPPESLPPKKMNVAGKPAWIAERERAAFLPLQSLSAEPSAPNDPKVYEARGDKMARAVPLRERFVIIPGTRGFYVLRFAAPRQDFATYLPDFDALLASFDILP